MSTTETQPRHARAGPQEAPESSLRLETRSKEWRGRWGTKLWSWVRPGLVEIRLNKARSFLSFFAVAIGSGAVLYTLAMTQGQQERMRKAFEIVGPGRFEIERKEGYVSRGLSAGLTYSDARAIREKVPWLFMVYPLVRRWSVPFSYQDFHTDNDVMALGTTPEWAKRDYVYTSRGRFLQEDDVRQSRRVCVLVEEGEHDRKSIWKRWMRESKYQSFLKHQDLLGSWVRLGDHSFRVVGILKEPHKDKDPRWFHRWYGRGTILVPITTFQKFLVQGRRGQASNPDQVDEIQVDTAEESTIPAARREVEVLLKQRHRGEEDYQIEDYRDVFSGMLKNMKEAAATVLALGIVSMLAGGIGIMNVMLATIFSRIKEIGIRRAIGATRSDILLQFLFEAGLLGLMGGLAGLGIGAAGAHYLSKVQYFKGEVFLHSWHFLATILVAVGTGLVAAFYPAWKASKMDPVEALRYE